MGLTEFYMPFALSGQTQGVALPGQRRTEQDLDRIQEAVRRAHHGGFLAGAEGAAIDALLELVERIPLLSELPEPELPRDEHELSEALTRIGESRQEILRLHGRGRWLQVEEAGELDTWMTKAELEKAIGFSAYASWLAERVCDIAAERQRYIVTIHSAQQPMRALRDESDRLLDAVLRTPIDRDEMLAITEYLRSVSRQAASILGKHDFLLGWLGGERKLGREEVNLQAALVEVALTYGGLADTKHLRISRPHIQADATIVGDRELITLSVANLVDNAIKYSFRGTPRNPREISVTLRETHESWHVSVADYGRFIPEDEREKVFGLHQTGSTSDPRHEVSQTGVGLWVVRTVAEAHGGKAWCEVGDSSVPPTNPPSADWVPAARTVFHMELLKERPADGDR